MLTWEFDVKIKPAFLAFIAFILLKVFAFLQISDPYTQALILRLITVLYAVLSIRWFIRRTSHMISEEFRPVYYFLSYFLWFLPLLNVRFLSESLSGILLLNTLSVLLKSGIRTKDYLLAGTLTGIGFLVRFPHAIIGMGIFFWLLLIRREKISRLLYMILSATGLVLLGVLLDFWLYGEFVLSFWEYFSANILGETASEFGTQAWWNYFHSIFRFSFFPIGIPIILSFLLLIIKKPKNIFIWTILPFFIIHSIIPHKELRYLFPFAGLVPILLLLAYQEIYPAIKQWSKTGRLILRYTFWLLILINCAGVFTVSLKPSDGGLMAITKHIRQEFGEESIRLISFGESNPYGPRGTMATFYMEKDMENFRMESLDELGSLAYQENRVNLLVLMRKDTESVPVQAFLQSQNITKVTQSMPEWMEPLLKLYGGYRMQDIRELYLINPKHLINPNQKIL